MSQDDRDYLTTVSIVAVIVLSILCLVQYMRIEMIMQLFDLSLWDAFWVAILFG